MRGGGGRGAETSSRTGVMGDIGQLSSPACFLSLMLDPDGGVVGGSSMVMLQMEELQEASQGCSHGSHDPPPVCTFPSSSFSIEMGV